MAQESPSRRSVHFGVFDLDLQSGELRKHGLKIRLPNQSFQILVRLLERPGEVVGRDELRHALWTDDTFVDFEVGLASAVRKLRDALGDSAENARFVETLPRRGYRFISPVTHLHHAAVTGTPGVVDTPEPISVVEPAGRPRSSHPTSTMVVILAMIVAGLAIASLVVVRRIGAHATPLSIQSIAVLPLANLTGDPGQDYFVDGLTDNIITELAQMTDVRVISRTSVMSYKQARKPAPAIRQELNVDAIVLGTVARSGSVVRINAQLIDTQSDQLLWAKSYDRDASDLVALESDVAKAIAGAIGGKVMPDRKMSRTASTHVSEEVNALFFRAVIAAGSGNFREAIKRADSAIAKQADFAPAYAAMAVWYNQFAFTGGVSPLEFMPKAQTAARKALELDETNSQAHAALGLVLYRFHWDWEGAEMQFRRALQINPSYAEGHRMLGVFLSAGGRTSEALAEALEARTLDPRSTQALLNLGGAHYDAGQIQQAISEFRTALEMSPELGRAHLQLGEAYLAQGDLNAGLKELRTAVMVSGRNPRFLAYLAYAEAITGNNTDARQIEHQLDALSLQQFVSPVDLAGIQIGLGQKEAAFASLENAYGAHDPQLVGLRTDQRMKALRSDARFEALERRVGLLR